MDGEKDGLSTTWWVERESLPFTLSQSDSPDLTSLPPGQEGDYEQVLDSLEPCPHL